ncbi:NFAT activation molecule 1 isoform B [Alligator mississippiensis]|uniref:NFAT activation molecule 1 isoform B n=1 Tax=Alligator mississippiensis TaxID=8496 RepID=A0A151LYW9_ALLMI|nr:NFAT activation molecule 1 isoform B [Alligator mississippiensis]
MAITIKKEAVIWVKKEKIYSLLSLWKKLERAVLALSEMDNPGPRVQELRNDELKEAGCKEESITHTGAFLIRKGSIRALSLPQHHPEGGQVEVQQESLIQVAFANEQVLMTCLVSFPRTTHYSSFIGSCYLLNSKGQRTTIKTCSISVPIPAGQENQTAKESYRCDIEPYKAASGTYYCEANWTSLTQKGHGTFVLVRDTGYLEHSPITWTCLVTLTTLLAALSITTTALLLWKRKVVCPKRSQPQSFPVLGVRAPATSGSSEPSGSIYTCLESHQPDIYSVLENDTHSPIPENSPTAKPKSTNSEPARDRHRSEDCEKPGRRKKKMKDTTPKQETPEETFDTLVFNTYPKPPPLPPNTQGKELRWDNKEALQGCPPLAYSDSKLLTRLVCVTSSLSAA